MENAEYISKIKHLKQRKNAIILAHYYQIPEIQELGDFVGDSLALAQKAANTDADIIVFCGVHFMAETAKILNPHKKVILPDLKAGCSLAESCKKEDLAEFKEQYPNHIVVSYVNASAGVKTLTDIVVTSSNAKKIIDSIPIEQNIIFAPDKNLGAYLNKVTGRNMVLWQGSCVVHEAFSLEKVEKLILKHPRAKLIAHPESEAPVLNISDFVGSTAKLLEFVEKDDAEEFIIATETGIFHEMKKRAPHKRLIPMPVKDEYECNCSECAFMKMNTLEKLYLCLKKELPQIHLDQKTIQQALPPIQRMLSLS